MVVEIYGHPISAPWRIAALTAAAVGAPHTLKVMAVEKQEHKSDWYVKMNPQHNVPYMKDGDFGINESRAIAMYLVNKYGGGDHKLYPNDPQVRGVIDQRLYFDCSAFYTAFMDVTYPQFLEDPRPPSKIHNFEGKMARMKEVLGWANDFCSKTGYMAGTNHVTLADISFATSYVNIVALNYFDLSPYPALNAWLKRMEKEIPKYQEINQQGADIFGQWWKSMRVTE